MKCSLLVFSQDDLQSAGCVKYKSGVASAEWDAQGMNGTGGMKSIGEICDSENRVLMKHLSSSSLAAGLAHFNTAIHFSEASMLITSTDRA